MSDNFSEEEKKVEENSERLEKLVADVKAMFSDFSTISDIRGISPQELEALYKVGLGFYRAGNMENAEKVFKVLVMIEHTCAKYHVALGAVRQVAKQYDLALQSYALAGLLDITSPKPHYYAGECNFAKGDLENAASALEMLLENCPAGVGENDLYRAKAEKLQKAIAVARGKQA